MSEPKNPEPARKIGAGHAEAMARLGLKELRNAFDPSIDGKGVSDNEYGLYGTLTPGEVARGREGDGQAYGDLEEESPSVDAEQGAGRDYGFGSEVEIEEQQDQDMIGDILKENNIAPPEAERDTGHGY